MIYDVLPGAPVPEARNLGPGGSRFTHMAQMMGELLAAFRRLPAADLQLDDLWADPQRLAAAAAGWADQLSVAWSVSSLRSHGVLPAKPLASGQWRGLSAWRR